MIKIIFYRKSNKPIKPRTTVQVVSDTETDGGGVIPLNIVCATYRTDESLCIGYGSEHQLVFENIVSILTQSAVLYIVALHF